MTAGDKWEFRLRLLPLIRTPLYHSCCWCCFCYNISQDSNDAVVATAVAIVLAAVDIVVSLLPVADAALISPAINFRCATCMLAPLWLVTQAPHYD